MKTLSFIKPATNIRPTLLGLVFLVLALMASHGNSLQVNGLYDALVPVADRSVQARDEAFQLGFIQVVKRVTGSSKVADNEALANSTSSAQRYISGFGYQSLPATTASDSPQLMLQINFSAQAIDNLLRAKQLPIWPSDRDPLLVWMVIDEAESGRHWIGEQWFPEAVDYLTSLAKQRGLPVVIPVLDLQDKLNFPVKAAWELESEVIGQASARYQPDNWLLLRFFKTANGSWRGSSWLNSNGKQALTNHQGDSLEEFIANAINKVTDTFSQQYAFVPRSYQGDGIPLKFEGLISFQDFKALKKTLEDMEIVSRFTLLEMKSNEVTIEVSIDGEQQLFLDALARNSRLRSLGGQSATRHFLWLAN